MNESYTYQEAATILAISVDNIRHLVHRQKLSTVPFGKKKCITAESIIRYLHAKDNSFSWVQSALLRTCPCSPSFTPPPPLCTGYFSLPPFER